MSDVAANLDRQEVLRRAFLELKELRGKVEAYERARSEPIAIIGLGCRFPGGADTPETFWQLLENGVDATREVPPDRWDVAGYYDPSPDAPGKMYTRRGGFLDRVDSFDALFFGIPPREAVSMDPQHRLVLEVCWEAVENAGMPPGKLAGSRTGVFVGMTSYDYAQLCLKAGDPAQIDAYISMGNPFNFAVGRVAYLLGLQGPALAVDTACSSSLVAVHLACQSLRSGECSLALAGGVNLILSPETNVALCKARMLAADGRCKTFDAAADGYGRGEGCGIVVLKRLSDAIAGGDNVLAVIRGSAVNQNGPSSGITVPSATAQQELIRSALDNARVEPLQVGYVEVHGTGTALGDPIEVRALAGVMGKRRLPEQRLMMGSVKTNIGHLEAAAGIAGLIKVVLALQHREIPPHLHLTRPNTNLAWEDLPVTIPTRLTPWSAQRSRIAGVSSFGVSGTNAHIILEEAPVREGTPRDRALPLHLLALSAKNESALRAQAGRFAAYLQTHPSVALADVCCIANARRDHFSYRLAATAASSAAMHGALAAFAAGDTPAGVTSGKAPVSQPPKIAFLFTGQGAQYQGMAHNLYETQPVFRAALDRCAGHLRPYLAQPLLDVLYPPQGMASPLDDTAYTQPALFAVEYSLVQLWRSWGIEPAAVIGHSVGEYVAACVAGVFSLEDGLRLIAERGRLMSALPRDGAMIAVFAPEAQVTAALAPHHQVASIAAVNGPAETVISGRREAVEAIAAGLAVEGVKSRRLTVSHAFHSPLMAPILEDFGRAVMGATYAPPRLALVSNASGRIVDRHELINGEYWQRHVMASVRFADGIKALHAHGYRTFVEIGPAPVLLGLGRRCIPEDGAAWLPSLRPGRGDWEQLLASLGELYVRGATVNWAEFGEDPSARRLALPTYPFQRERYWVEGAPVQNQQARHSNPDAARAPLPGVRLSSPLPQVQFETEMSIDNAPLVSEHRIYGTCVVPGVVYLEMVIGAAEQVFPNAGSTMAVENLALVQPLILDEGETRAVQLVMAPEAEGSAAFQIFSRLPREANQSGQWTLHASGRLRAGEAASGWSTAEPAVLADIPATRGEELTGSEFYARVWHPEFALGTSFRRIDRVWRGAGEAWGRLVAPPEEMAGQSASVRTDLLLIDAAVQLLVAARPSLAGAAAADVYVGTGEDLARVRGPLPPGPLWCHARLREDEGDALAGDLWLYDNSGQAVAEVCGARLKRVRRETLQRVARLSRDEARAARGSLSREKLLAAMPGARQQLLERYVGEELARVLGMPVAQLDVEQPPAGMIDSLMAVELKTRIEADLAVAVPVTAFFESQSIADFAAILYRHLMATDASIESPYQEDGVDEASVAEMLADLEQLSETDAQTRLAAAKQGNGRKSGYE